jgi:DNA-binding MarR family transcriptional regulator
MDDIPLARLLTMSLRLLIDDMHRRLEAQGLPELRPAHGFALNAIAEAGMTTAELAELMGVTKQGAAKLVASMIDLGFVTTAAHATDRRARLVVLTPRGRTVLTAAVEAQRAMEQELRATVGARDVTALRRTLRTLIEQHHGEGYPPLRPVW